MSENTPTREDFREAIESVAGGGVFLERIVDVAWGLHQERLRVLEVIRQRVSDGWTADRDYDFGVRPPMWMRPGRYPEEIEPDVAGVLWPDEDLR